METPEVSTLNLRLRRALGRGFRALWPEGSRAAALFVAAFFMGVVYVSTWGGPPEFWQQIFGPSVMMACGEGFTNPRLDEVPGLEDFLYLRAETFDCGNIPEGVAVLPENTLEMPYDDVQAFHPEPQFRGWTQWQRFHRYLLWSVALCFTLFGVAWSSLTPLYGLLYGLTSTLSYGIFRLAMGRRTATLFSVLLMTSPVHLQQLPQLRDYSKAPFFFLIILAMGWLLKGPLPLRLQLPLAALAGFAGGIGLGFRQDITFAAAVFCILVALFFPGPIKKTWWRRGLILAVFIGAFAVPGAPIARVLSGVNNATHDTIIGFTSYCDQRLGVAAPLYDYGDPFLDEYVRAILMGHAYRTAGRTEVFRHYSPPYDAAGKAYFRELAVTFPADMIIRGYASVLRIVDELQISSADGAPRGITNQFAARLYQWRQAALDGLPGGGRYYVAAMLLALGAVRPRQALAAFVAIMILAGYPALRFSERHAFHMEIVALFALGFLLYGAWACATAAWRHRNDLSSSSLTAPAKALTLRGGITALTIAAMLLVPLGVARLWQARQVEALLAAYAAADRELVRSEITAGEGGETFVGLPTYSELAGRSPALPMYTDVLVLEFDAGSTPVAIHFQYEADHHNFRFNRSMTVPAAAGGERAGPTQVYYPVYYGNDAHFQGFTVAAEDMARFRGVYRLTDIRDRGILLNAVLPPDWAQGPFYQTFSR